MVTENGSIPQKAKGPQAELNPTTLLKPRPPKEALTPHPQASQVELRPEAPTSSADEGEKKSQEKACQKTDEPISAPGKGDIAEEAVSSASPQVEDGHIDVANELGEAFFKLQLSGNQWRVLWVILRQTYGWHKKVDRISITYFERKTELKRRHVVRALNDMVERKIVTKNDTTFITTYGIQKNYLKWKPLPKMTLLSDCSKDKAMPVVDKPLPKMTVPKNDTKTVTKIGTHKRNSKEKDILSGKPDGDSIPYEKIISYLNQKTGKNFRHTTKETRGHIRARWSDGFRMDDFKRVIDSKSAKWKSDPKMSGYLRPLTLFGTKFESYLNEAPPEPTW